MLLSSFPLWQYTLCLGFIHQSMCIRVQWGYLASKSVVADTSWSFLGAFFDGTAFDSCKGNSIMHSMCEERRELEY